MKTTIKKMIGRIIPTSTLPKVLGVAALTFMSFGMMAGNGNNTAIKPENVIAESFRSSGFVNSQSINEKVVVVFTTDKKGNVDYCQAKSENNKLKNEIEQRFLKLNFKSTDPNAVYTVVLNFKTL